jgi:hypothetical protein
MKKSGLKSVRHPYTSSAHSPGAVNRRSSRSQCSSGRMMGSLKCAGSAGSYTHSSTPSTVRTLATVGRWPTAYRATR